jgi:ketosteroid isomerase-like protein
MTPLEFATSLIESFAAHDRSRYFEHFHPDATFLFHDTPGLVQSRADYEAMWAGWERDAGFQVLGCVSTGQRVQEYADLAVFTHSVHTVRLIDGTQDEVFERETIVLLRQGTTWTCVHEHLSPDPEHLTA